MHPVLAFLSSLWHSLLTMLSSLFGQQNEPEPQQKVDHDRIASSEKQITSPEPSECFLRSIPTEENILKFTKKTSTHFHEKQQISMKNHIFFMKTKFSL